MVDMAHDVFLSYSAKDKPAADAVCAALEAQGVRCWIAPRDATPGEPWAASIVAGIQASRAMVLIFSSRSNDSEHVLREVSAAAEAGLAILTLRIEDREPSKELGYYIRRAHWLDAFAPPLEAHLTTLGASVRPLLTRPATSDPGARRAPVAGALGSGRRRRLLLTGLLALGLVAGAVAWLRRSATLAIESDPTDAAVGVDGQPAGMTPLALSVASGSHGIVVRRPGFKDWSKVVEVGAGDRVAFSFQLKVADVHDAASVNLLAQRLGVALQQFTLPEAQRESVEGAPLELIVPRGAVRPADLAALVMDVDPERVDVSGVIALRRGTTTLWETPFQPQAQHYEVLVPEAVRGGLQVGETLLWGWWPSSGPAVTVELHVVPDAVAPLVADIERRLATQDAPVRDHLRAQALLDHQLFTGAFLLARALGQADASDVRASAVMWQALLGLGAGELRLAASLRATLRDAPNAERAKVFGLPPAKVVR
jgi:hypothetical protein